ncbi:MAG: response regulator [Cyclobacteriaceae bacterium]
MIDKNIKIILVDDDEDDRMLFGTAIESLDMDIYLTTKENGLELIEYLKKPETIIPDLLFLDLNMPYMGGFECLSRIREDPKTKKLPVAIYSTSSSKKDMEEAFMKGANIYINKPNDYNKLKLALKQVICTNWQYKQAGFDMDSFILNL